jgi:protein-tyrosine phosphatase
MASSGSAPLRILIVCTGNICRSPMGQMMLASRMRSALGNDAARLVEVTSAGTYGLVGHAIEPDAAAALDELGVVPDEFAARELARDIVEQQDLVLTATREHRAATVSMLPRASRWMFTIREFARLVDAADTTSGRALVGDPVARARALIDAAAPKRGYVRAPSAADDDVADPYRRSIDAFRVAAQQIDEATQLIADRITQVMRP